MTRDLGERHASGMSELEIRLAAVELLLAEVVPWIDHDVILDATAAIKAGLFADLSAEEAEIRFQAIELLTDGRRRFEPFAVGAWIHSG